MPTWQNPKVSATPGITFARNIILKARIAGPDANGLQFSATTTNPGGSPQLILTATNSALCCANVANAPVTQDNPAVPGETIIVYATGFDFGTGALTRMGVKGRAGLDLSVDWADGPADFGGFSAHLLPNFYFPGGPHGAGGGNYPRYSQDQVDWITGTLAYRDEFTVALRDSNGIYRSWSTSRVKFTVESPADAHAEQFPKYTDDDIHNLMAYLQTLK